MKIVMKVDLRQLDYALRMNTTSHAMSMLKTNNHIPAEPRVVPSHRHLVALFRSLMASEIFIELFATALVCPLKSMKYFVISLNYHNFIGSFVSH